MLGISRPCQAWDASGHAMVAEVARRHLDKNVLDSVQHYLGIGSFADAATWMDEIRKEPVYDYMKPWHYVNIDADKTYVATEQANIINALQTAISDLKNKNKHSFKEIRTSLRILFHLVGDLHQPLHVGYGSDKGGNDVVVNILSRRSNLHRVWDIDILEAKTITADDCDKLALSLNPEELKRAQRIDVIAWMEGSRALLPRVYDFKDGLITKDYVNQNAPLAAAQIALAGIRLASVLNDTFRN
jgi:hypothetical protein